MTARLTRLLASALLLAGGIIHYELWNSGYRNVPKIGPLFLAIATEVGAIAALGWALTMQHRQRQPLLHTIRAR
jgi:hypothetical protein